MDLVTARSAMSALGLMFDNVLVGAHPLVIRFMKGVFNLRPVRMKNVCIWDVSIEETFTCKYVIVTRFDL